MHLVFRILTFWLSLTIFKVKCCWTYRSEYGILQITKLTYVLQLNFLLTTTCRCLKILAEFPCSKWNKVLVSTRVLNGKQYQLFFDLPFQSYFKDAWNTFDFVTVVGSIVDALMVEFAVSAAQNVDPMEDTISLIIVEVFIQNLLKITTLLRPYYWLPVRIELSRYRVMRNRLVLQNLKPIR